MNCKNTLNFTKRKAFTLIELLIVIAIIGILFIVLVSKVDFATDKAKATGVQTDFRSFQMAFDTVAKENAGFNTFGWDTGDLNADGIRNSYDEGDTNKDGKQDTGEVWTGHKVYAETFTKVYSLVKPETTGYDRDALNGLETAINANLDPKLHITIKDDGEIVMANCAHDPWNKEYHGWYITNAEVDKKDRGAIVIYSDGPNNVWGSKHEIANGIVTITNPGNSKDGKDDYSLVSCYTYLNGYGEVKNITTGFSNNQDFLNGVTEDILQDTIPDDSDGDNTSTQLVSGMYDAENNLLADWETLVKPVEDGGYGMDIEKDHTFATNSTDSTAAKYILRQLGATQVIIDGSVSRIGDFAFRDCTEITKIEIRNGVTSIGTDAFCCCRNLNSLKLPDTLTFIGDAAFYSCENLNKIELPDSVTELGAEAFAWCYKLKEIKLSNNLSIIKSEMFINCDSLETVIVPPSVHTFEEKSFWGSGIVYINIPSTVVSIGSSSFSQCYRLAEVCNQSTIPNDQLGSQFHLSIINDPSDSKIVKQGDFVFYDDLNGLVLVGYSGNDSNVELPKYNNQQYIVKDYAFTGDRTIVNLTVPEYVTNLQDCVYYATKIETITLPGTNMVSIITSKYYKLTTLKSIYVPADLVEVYKNDQYWSIYSDLIKPIQ